MIDEKRLDEWLLEEGPRLVRFLESVDALEMSLAQEALFSSENYERAINLRNSVLRLIRLGLWAKEHGIPLIKQARHARLCNSPYGQLEKFPTINEYDDALAALPQEMKEKK
jgi:hypothetical protein